MRGRRVICECFSQKGLNVRTGIAHRMCHQRRGRNHNQNLHMDLHYTGVALLNIVEWAVVSSSATEHVSMDFDHNQH